MEAPVSPGTDKNNTPHPYEELCAVSCLHASMLHGYIAGVFIPGDECLLSSFQ